MDVDEYNVMYQKYHDDVHWKMVTHLDEVHAARAAAHNREVKALARKNPGQTVQASMKAPKENSAQKVYDMAQAEITVAQNEISRYMI